MSESERQGAGGARKIRRSKRAKRRLTCSFSIGGQFYRGITLDLSAEGLFIQTDATTTPGSEVEIDLIGSGKTPDVHVRGVIARRRAVPVMLASAVTRGIGVRLIEAPREYGLLYQDRPLDRPVSLGRSGGSRARSLRAGWLPPLSPWVVPDETLEREAVASAAPPAPPPSAPVRAAPAELARPDVLLMDDGSLGPLAEILAQIGAEGLCIRTTRGRSPHAWVRPRRLLITTAPLALSFPWPECSGEEGFTGIALAEHDSQTLSARISRLGFRHLIRRSIEPETLRCLLRQLLHRGLERRRVPRFPLDCPVACGSGLRRSPARLVELSVRGCRLLMDMEVSGLPTSAKITLRPDPMERGLTLRGRVVRRERNPYEGCKLSLAIAFERLSSRARSRLDALLRHCNEGHVHPPRSRLALAPFLVATRRSAPSGPELAPDCASAGSDLSITGVQASSLHPGLRFAVELFEGPYSEPLRIGAEVFKEEDGATLGLRFVDAGRPLGRGPA
jgi:hypothetical protein